MGSEYFRLTVAEAPGKINNIEVLSLWIPPSNVFHVFLYILLPMDINDRFAGAGPVPPDAAEFNEEETKLLAEELCWDFLYPESKAKT